MTATNILLAATLASALLGLFLLAMSRRSRQTRGVGFKQAKKLEPTEHNVGTAEDWLRMTADQLVADAMTSRGRKARGRIAALGSRLRHCQARVAQARHNLADADARLEVARDAAEAQRPPALSGRVLKLLYVLLYTGDLVVITAAILAENAQTPPGLALLSATALATALFVVGKFLGHHARDWMQQSGHHRLGTVLVAVFTGLTVFGLSLMVLRLGSIWAWLVLSISPALGAGALMTLGPTVEQSETDKRDRAHSRSQRRLVAAQRALDRMERTKDQLDAESSYDMRKTALQAEAELVRLGIDRSKGRLYMIQALQDCNDLVSAVHGEAGSAIGATAAPSADHPAVDPETRADAAREPAVFDADLDYRSPTQSNGTEPVGAAPRTP